VIGFVGVAAAGREAAGDVGERQAAVVEEPMSAQHRIGSAMPRSNVQDLGQQGWHTDRR
jgi:hypothetical protein